ncbi:hypothetical protein RFN57_33910 [Streptomyces violaceochromogenes]|uniref:Uncharacterized protein n=1 Tax=Streptomyces violaceochromogenes TaxID=67377 RepID=A0ABU6M638_9ACTN|nr:hypothetical protein [Streptomyces violaceochromogenes]MEC7057246.1 hypothetical protein [Streptomyces violaceochromogenes]GHC93761.1 hypothetical protein GCM10010309_78490 [Streptomyces violaceochromogenes]
MHTGGRLAARAEDPDGTGEATNDLERAHELRSAVLCAGVLLSFLLLLDWGSGLITPWRSLLWCVLAGLLYAVLYPQRVSAGGNWLTTRGLVRGHRVRTDLLVSVRCLDGVSQRLLLRDRLEGRVEIDPGVLVHHPHLWFCLERGARKAADDGSLLCGATALRRLSERVGRETARAVFKISGLE